MAQKCSCMFFNTTCRSHKSVMIIRRNQVVGGITYRPYVRLGSNSYYSCCFLLIPTSSALLYYYIFLGGVELTSLIRKLSLTDLGKGEGHLLLFSILFELQS